MNKQSSKQNSNQTVSIVSDKLSEILIFIPAYNEADNIKKVVQDVFSVFTEDVNLVVIDDGSSDNTAEIARRAGAKVIELPMNEGAGAAAQTGYIYAKYNNYKFAGQLDADGQHRASDLKKLIEKVIIGRCDFSLGSRYLNKFSDKERQEALNEYNPTITRKIGSWVFSKMLSLSTGKTITDITSGMRACNRHIIDQFSKVYDPDYAEIESLQRCLNLQFNIKEYEVIMLDRFKGKSKITPWHSTTYAFRAFTILLIGIFRKEYDRKHLNSKY